MNEKVKCVAVELGLDLYSMEQILDTLEVPVVVQRLKTTLPLREVVHVEAHMRPPPRVTMAKLWMDGRSSKTIPLTRGDVYPLAA
jgi:hypothetical protein